MYEGYVIDADKNRTDFLQYNTASMGHLITFVLFSDNEIDEADRQVMASIMQRVTVSKVRNVQGDVSDDWMYLSDAKEINPSELEYTFLDDGTVSIKNYTGSLPDIIIPSSLDGRSVSSIIDGFSNNSGIRSIKVQDGIKPRCPAGQTTAPRKAFHRRACRCGQT